MASGIVFNGATYLHPGGASQIIASALAGISQTPNGIIAILGEADGGQPGVVYTIDDPSLAATYFKSGPLANAIKLAFQATADPTILNGASRVLAYKTNASTKSGSELPMGVAINASAPNTDVIAAGTTTTSIVLGTGGFVAPFTTANAYVGRWFLISGEARRIVSVSSATTAVVSPGFSKVFTNGTVTNILKSSVDLSSRDYGLHTTQIGAEWEAGSTSGTNILTLSYGDKKEQSPELGGIVYLRVKYNGGPILKTSTGNVAVTTVSAVADTISADLGLTPGTFNGKVVELQDGRRRLITSSTNTQPAIITLAAGHELTAADLGTPSSPTVTLVKIRDITTATASMVGPTSGAGGKAVTFSTTVTATADDLTLSFSTIGTTLRQFADYLNSNTNFVATIPNGINPDTTLLRDFDFDSTNTAVDVRFDALVDPTNKGRFFQNTMALVNWVNTNATLASAVRSSQFKEDGAGVPQVTGGVTATLRDGNVIYLVGGLRGMSTNSSFQTGFDTLIMSRHNYCIPLIAQDLTNEGNGSTATWDSVAAQLIQHVTNGRTSAKNEMGGLIGYKGTKTNILTKLAALNDTDVQMTAEGWTVLDASGTLVAMDEWSSAVGAASMRAGAPEVGTPLTFKFVKTNAVSRDSSWNPASRTDSNALIAAGLLFTEQTTAGFRWVRDETTYTKDDNIAFVDGNTRDACRFVSYDFRTFLENRFTGIKATPANLVSIRDQSAVRLGTYRTQNIIVDSLDPETRTKVVPGFRNLRVSISGNVATVKVEIFPVTGIVFELITIYLQLPQLVI